MLSKILFDDDVLWNLEPLKSISSIIIKSPQVYARMIPKIQMGP